MNSIFDTTRRKPDYILLATVGALLAFGLVMVYSASFVEAYTLHNTHAYYIVRQLVFAVVGVGALLVAQRIHYTFWRRFSVALLGTTVVLLVLVLILPESMTMVNDSRSWIRFGGGLLSVQPSELVKVALVIYMADWLSRSSDRLRNVTYGLIPLAVILGGVCGLVMLEPDRGTTFILLIIAGSIYFAAGANLLHIVGAGTLSIGAFWLLINVARHHGRIAAYINPWEYYDTYGYQPIHALYALGSGGVFGAGLGQARQKFQWLPQAHTDTIYAILGEELGLIGTLLVLGGFMLIAWRGYRIAARVDDPFAALVAVGLTSWVFFQAMVNIAVTTSLIPFTGLTLPFLSYGGTSLVTSLGTIGILLNISRHTSDAPRKEEAPHVAPDIRSPALVYFHQQTRRVAALLSQRRRNGGTRLPRAGSRGSAFSSRRPSSRSQRTSPGKRAAPTTGSRASKG